ncbi:MAG: PEP-CTERM sorting domain-containing protein [Phycisphaeraceae bacterium]
MEERLQWLSDEFEDSDVDRTDAALFSQYYGTTSGSVWTTGDFNGDAATTLADYGLLQSHLGMTAPSPSAAAAAVPEPSASLMLLFGMAASIVAFARVTRRRAKHLR